MMRRMASNVEKTHSNGAEVVDVDAVAVAVVAGAVVEENGSSKWIHILLLSALQNIIPSHIYLQ